MNRTASNPITVTLSALSLLCFFSSLVVADPLDEWTWLSQTPTGNDLNGIAFGGDRYVAVGEYGTILTSTNGIGWTQQTSGTQEHLLNVSYGNGMFVATAGNFRTENWTNAMFVSPDGTHWTRHSIRTTNVLAAAPFANGRFFAIAQSQSYTELFASTDGVNWPERRTMLFPGALFDIAFGNGTFAAVADQGIVWTSVDGIDWIRRDTGFPKTYLRSITFGSGMFVGAGGNRPDSIGGPWSAAIWTSVDGVTWAERKRDDIANDGFWHVEYRNGSFVAWGGSRHLSLLWTSTDAITWTDRSAIASLSQAEVSDFRDIAHGNDQFVIVGARGMILTSKDGTTWATLPTRTQETAPSFTSICYGNGTFVAVASKPDPRNSGNLTNAIFTTSDGMNWTPRVALNDGSPVMFANGVFIAVGDDGILTSADGVTWTQRLKNWIPELLAYGNGTFVTLLGGPYVSISKDALTWTSSKIISMGAGAADAYLTCLTYGHGLFVAAGTEGIWTSTNGLVWAQKYKDPSFNPWRTDAAYGDGRFVVVGQGWTLTSLDGIAWTKQDVGVFHKILYANGTFVALQNRGAFRGGRGNIQTSPDGIAWTSRITVSPGLTSIAYGNGRFMAVGYGAVLQSGLVGPRLRSTGLSVAGDFHFVLLGEPGQSYQMETSSDLVNWLPFRTNKATGLALEFEDADAVKFPRRFYRARQVE